MQKKTIKILAIVAGVLVFVAAISALLGISFAFKDKPTSNDTSEKSIVIEVVDANEDSTTYNVLTEAECLEEAMNEADGLVYETNDGMVMVINGVRADYVLDGAYWSFYVNGDYCNYGIAEQPVNDGDHFRIVYTKA